MARELPKEFNMKDLFIDVKLEACVDGSSYDFLGRKLFSTEFFRESIGFGITSIDIEVNTSLQPLVSITFKDLYGATIFGGQNRDGSGDDNQSIDYSILFNWPPPKFLFSFKGYLGKPASWVLNLKKTSTSFNSSDGSYDIKCEFVPNQWGFFADLPFLYLLAAKTLRRDKIGRDASEEQKKAVTSVFDLIKIGKQVEVKTQDTTKEFDELMNQLGSVKSNLARAASVSNIVEFESSIDGVVNNRAIVNFQKMKIPSLKDLGPSLDSREKIEEKLSNTRELNKLNTYLLLLVKFEYSGEYKDGFSNYGIASRNYESFDVNNSEISSAKNQTIELINKNIKKIEDEIKRVVFSTSEKKLEKITIGEIFSQLAKDSGFIIGSILDAGFNGYMGDSDRQRLRDDLSDRLIGQAFPMFIKDGEEVPATKENLQEDIGVDNYEMSFVRNFISAISEGIAKDLPSDSTTGLGDEDSALKQRINNIEMISNNPYKPSYSNIATNILVRGGIVGYMTRSDDPNKPGSYDNFIFDNDSIDRIKTLADRDSQNITDSIINNLTDIDKLLLLRFCNFINKLFVPDGEKTFDNDGNPNITIENSNITDIINYPVIMSKSSSANGKDDVLTFKELWNQLKSPSTLENAKITENEEYGISILIEPASTNQLSNEPIQSGIINAQNPLSFVDENTFSAKRIMNNGLVYTYPNGLSTKGSPYWAIVFRGKDNVKAQEVNSSPTDAEYKSSDKDVGDFGQNEPLGYIPINSKFGDDGVTTLKRVSSLEDYRDNYSNINSSVVFDFESLKNPNPTFYGATPQDSNIPDVEQFLWDKKIASNYIEQTRMAVAGTSINDIELAGDFGWTVCAHQSGGFDKNLVFGLFNDSSEGQSQRIFIYKICENIKKTINKIDEEKSQVISSVLGKAGEQENSIYKQMHTLYHQWQSLSYSSEKTSNGCLIGDVNEHKDANSFNIAEALEKKYGGNHINILVDDFVEVDGETISLSNYQDSNGVPDGAFIYDYPLQRINPKGEIVQVRDSIINLESLYKANGETSVLNIIQQVCTKNNFLFVPIPGNPNYLNVNDIYTPYSEPANIDIRNFFHVLFTPTPESRTKTKNKDGTSLSLSENHKTYNTNSFVIQYGHPDNQIVSNIQVGTDDTKVTAESIVNLQRLVDNENQNKKVTTDCSMLPVLAGRSYKASIDILGNAQVYPMQFFFLENSPLFGGLYQIMKVKHNISPNDFKTSAEGIRMRFSPGDGYGSIKPITLQTFRDLGKLNEPQPFTKEEVSNLANNANASLISGIANTSSYDPNRYVDGNKGGPVALVVPILTASELQEYDLGVGVREVWERGSIVGSEQMYLIDGDVMNSKTLSAYKKMRDAARSEGINLGVNSGYRDPFNDIVVNGKKIASSQLSLRKQNVIDKSKVSDINYLKTASSKLFNKETGRPGGSNHGAGKALDLNTGGNKRAVDMTIYKWLTINAYKYGFIRAVPSEEWHWEYSPGKSMFSVCLRDNPKWYGLPDALNIPITKDEIKVV